MSSSWLVVLGAVGVIASLASLLGLGMGLARIGDYGGALTCLGAFAVIILLTFVGIECADEFWRGRP